MEPIVHGRILKSLSIAPILSQISLIQAPILFLNIRFHIILLSLPRTSKLLLAFSFTYKNPTPPLPGISHV
jgi:hypothetical protein